MNLENYISNLKNHLIHNLGLLYSSATNSSPQEERCPQGGEVRDSHTKNPSKKSQENSSKKLKPTTQEYNNLSSLPYLKTFRKNLRVRATPAEKALWKFLKGKQLEGRKFRRQHSFGNYILDFYCPTERLAIELDGQYHFEITQMEKDKERDLFMAHYGINVLRFENKVVWENLHGLLEEIKSNFGKGSWEKGKEARVRPVSPADSSPLSGEQYVSFGNLDLLDYINVCIFNDHVEGDFKELDKYKLILPSDGLTFWDKVLEGQEFRDNKMFAFKEIEDCFKK